MVKTLGDVVSLDEYRKRRKIKKVIGTDNSTQVLQQVLGNANQVPIQSYDKLTIIRDSNNNFNLYPNDQHVPIEQDALKAYIDQAYGTNYSSDPVGFIVAVAISIAPKNLQYILVGQVTNMDREILTMLNTMFNDKLTVLQQQ